MRTLGVELSEIQISLPRIMKAVPEAVQFERARMLSCQTAAPTRGCRHYLSRAPAGDRRVVSRGGVTSELDKTTASWIERRRAFLDAVGGEEAVRFLVRAPQILLAEPAVRTAAERLMESADCS